MTGLTHGRLLEALNYDPGTGVFTWRVKTCSKVVIGRVAGCIGNLGYVYIRLDKALYYGHRLAWFYCHGAWPSRGIDHRNGVTSDNRLSNLREADQAENSQNIRLPRHNTSGYLGVARDRHAGKWLAQIQAGGVNHYLGHFEDPERAHAAYLSAKARLHSFQPEPRSAN